MMSLPMSLPAMTLGLRFCVSRKGGTGGGGWVYPKGANSMAVYACTPTETGSEQTTVNFPCMY